MRIDQIDIEGYGPLTGSFRFPAEGLGCWASRNATGKTTLTTAVAAALYGDVGPAAAAGVSEEGSPWVMIGVTRDDGESLVIARDLADDSVQVTDGAGRNVTAQYRDPEGPVEVGEKLLGLTRSQFLEAAVVRFDELRDTPENRALLSLLMHGRGRRGTLPSSPRSTPPAPSPAESGVSFESVEPVVPVVPPPADPSPPEDDDLQIFRSPSEELGYAAPSAGPSDSGTEVGDDSLLETETPAPAVADPDEPGLAPADRLRRLKAGIDVLEKRLDAKREELRTNSIRLQETYAEADRLEAFAGAEPTDVEKLRSLLDVMRKIQEKREQLRVEEQAFREELDERGVPIERIDDLDGIFRRLSEQDHQFIEEFRQGETIRRGTQALIRSESRLDETRIQEILQSRQASARLAVVPLALSIVGLFGSIGLHLFPLFELPTHLLLGLGLTGAVLGAFLLWRARGLGERDRLELVASLDRKQAQTEELEKEAQYAVGRLAVLCEDLPVELPSELTNLHGEWKDRLPELKHLESFVKRAAEIDREIVTVQEKLGSFSAAEGQESADMASKNLDTMYQDYVRFFEVRQELEHQEDLTARIEGDLAGIETEKAELAERLRGALTRAGIDPDRDLEESIELYALKAGDVDIDPPASAAEDAEKPVALVDYASGETTWTSAVSARTEAIARRFVPGVREIEVDAELRLSLKLDTKGERFALRDLARTLSAGVLDQLCLALRLAIVETLSSSAERIPLFLDDPLLRADDQRHDLALDFLVEDACARNQVVLLTAQEVRSKWFLHQFPQHRTHVTWIMEPAAAPDDDTDTDADVDAAIPSEVVSHHFPESSSS